MPRHMNDCPPPWIALPGLSPDDPATQGVAEAYVVLTWLPFWQSQSTGARAAYLDRWQASPAWRAVIAERYDADPEMIAQDAREAAAWAAAHPPAPLRQPWWRRRL